MTVRPHGGLKRFLPGNHVLWVGREAVRARHRRRPLPGQQVDLVGHVLQWRRGLRVTSRIKRHL